MGGQHRHHRPREVQTEGPMPGPHLKLRAGEAVCTTGLQPANLGVPGDLTPQSCGSPPAGWEGKDKEEKCTFCKFQWEAFGEGS